MSVAWEVRLVCDRCGTASTGVLADRALYGQTLESLREALGARGWDSRPYGRGQCRDYCPACAGTRR